MQMQSDWLQERYEFAGWRESSGTEPSVVGIGFRFLGNELPGWRLHRSRSLQVAGAPPAVLSIWAPEPAAAGLLAVDVYEASTASNARTQLLKLLGEFQGPLLERDATVGEVGFRAASGALLFVRGNYAVQVRSVEREPVAPGGIAQRLDRHLAMAPDAEPAGAGPLRRASTVKGPVAPGQRVPLDLEFDPATGPAVWVRFFTPAGRILVEGGRAWYVAGPEGPRDISILAIGPDGRASRVLLRFQKESD